MKRKLSMLISFMFLLSVTAACSSDKTSKSEGGGDTGKITVYSPETPEMTEDLAKAFEKENSSDQVSVNYAGTNILVNKMLAEINNPQADVWYGGGGILPFETAVDKNILASYIPDVAEDWETVENGIKMKHEDGKYVGVEVFVLGFSYNTELVSREEAPKTWDDLLDPKWKGKIQLPNPAASGTATLLVLSQLMAKGEKNGWEYFEKLVAQANAMPDAGSAPTQAVAKGEAYIGIGFDFMAYEQQAKGETVDFIVPDETPVIANPVSLIEGAPNPEGGKKFIDFLLSKDGQQILADWYHIPVNPEVKSKTPLTLEKAQESAMDLDIDWVVKNYDKVRNEWKEKFQ